MKINFLALPTVDETGELHRRFDAFLSSRFPGLADESEDRKFLFSAIEGEGFAGGITGNVYWNGLEIDTLWVEEKYRGRGVASDLLAAAESYARENDAVIAFLKTVEAKGFYERHGYQVYGVLEDRPIGTVLFHMKKRLD